jgi:uncharacterized SAM-binding protein YcdF (DUF218 family)
MPFTLAKILALLAQPSTLMALALIAGLMLMRWPKRERLGRRLAWGAVIYLVVAGLFPLGNFLVLPLEQRFASVPRPADGDKIDGIIILGGFEDGWVSTGRGMLGVNEAAERLTEGLRLALKHPEAKVVFTGGVGGLLSKDVEATGPVSRFLQDAGVAADRIVVEGRSRNTYENALFTRDIVKPKPGESWYLVTSAYHMPRAIGLFRKAGFDVTAYSVDYRTRGPEDLTRMFERLPAGHMRVDLGANEWIGLVAYRLLGRIDDVFPAP